jgi:hypothetical protein
MNVATCWGNPAHSAVLFTTMLLDNVLSPSTIEVNFFGKILKAGFLDKTLNKYSD